MGRRPPVSLHRWPTTICCGRGCARPAPALSRGCRAVRFGAAHPRARSTTGCSSCSACRRRRCRQAADGAMLRGRRGWRMLPTGAASPRASCSPRTAPPMRRPRSSRSRARMLTCSCSMCPRHVRSLQRRRPTPTSHDWAAACRRSSSTHSSSTRRACCRTCRMWARLTMTLRPTLRCSWRSEHSSVVRNTSS